MRKHKGDTLIIVLMIILMCVGLLVMYTIGPVRANFLNAAAGEQKYAESSFFIHQLISVVVSIGVFVVFAKFLNYEYVKKLAKVLMALALGSCVVLAIAQFTNMPIAICELGACRWIGAGPVSIQPAELVKFALVVYLAVIFTEYKGREFWIRYLVSVGASLFFVVVLQKDLGSGVPIAMIALFTLFKSGISWKSFALICISVVVLGVGAVLSSPHRRERFFTYFGVSDPKAETSEEEEDANAYHIENALIAIGTGGFLGVGIGNSVQATGYLPESINDSVFAIMGETFGFVGVVLVLFVFVWMLFRVLRVADYSSDNANSLIAVGAFAWIMTHLIVNVMAMTKIIPLTGITLPLLSYGGTSMMMVAGILGLCYQLSEYTSREVVIDSARKKKVAEKTNSFRRMEYEQVNYGNYRRRR